MEDAAADSERREVMVMFKLVATAKHTRYVMGSLTAVLFAACAGGS
jgi:hypothetical protein